MSAIELTVISKGHHVTALSETKELAKAYEGMIILKFPDFSVCVTSESSITDLVEIYRLNTEVIKLKKQIS